MKEQRLRRHMRVNPFDVILDNGLLPALIVLALVAYFLGG